jgi:cholesterol transport system auxiliary component
LARKTLALAMLGLAACTGSLFQSKAVPPTIYWLSPGTGSPGGAGAALPAPGTPAAKIPAELAILKPRVRTGLESDRIAVLYPDRHLDYIADARWSGPLSEMLQDLAVQEFHLRGALRTVSGDTSVFASAYWLEIEVVDFQAEYGSAVAAPSVHVHFRARLGGSGDRRLLGQFDATAQQTAAENRLSAIVDAYAGAADTVLSQIVAQVDETLASKAR